MKLWLKISLISIIMVTLATGICSFIMLMGFGKSNIDLAIEGVIRDQEIRMNSWKDAMKKEIDDSYSELAQRSLAQYLIRNFGNQNTILMSKEDSIYNHTSIDPLEYLAFNEEYITKYTIQDIDGLSYLLVGSSYKINGVPYSLYVIKDLTSIYNNIEKMAYQFSFVNLSVISVSALFIMGLILLILKPIKTLKKNTGLIASGIYDKRIEILEEDEIGDLANDFNLMAEAIEEHILELEDQIERRTLFMNALTHEIKTPITSISGNAQTLLLTKMEEEEREDALIWINKECVRVERLSKKLMDLIVLKNEESLELKNLNVSDFFEEIFQMSSENLKEKDIDLKIENSIEVLFVDKDLLLSLVLNLIDNAIKASERESIIELIGKDNMIVVKDYGRGIPEEEIARITEPFYMVDKSRSKKLGGMGLGLALSKELVRLHGAALLIESELGQGTSVKVVFNV